MWVCRKSQYFIVVKVPHPTRSTSTFPNLTCGDTRSSLNNLHNTAFWVTDPEMDIFIPAESSATAALWLEARIGRTVGKLCRENSYDPVYISQGPPRILPGRPRVPPPREKRCHFLRNIRNNNELLAAAVASVLHDAPHERSRSIVLRRSLTYLDDTMSQHEGSVSAHRARSTAAPRPDEQRMFVQCGQCAAKQTYTPFAHLVPSLRRADAE